MLSWEAWGWFSMAINSKIGNCRPALLAGKQWKPFFETTIDAFGSERCMFESNFPVDEVTSSYTVYWNTFKRIALNASLLKNVSYSMTRQKLLQFEYLTVAKSSHFSLLAPID